ncbi:hypothetical protein, partial [Virgibacillus halodenitrificans]|uniref:hypothetical protein n=1 Tax=Virgibacillus halodenitrificans TaxID=1482 RepID=UPI002DB9D8E7
HGAAKCDHHICSESEKNIEANRPKIRNERSKRDEERSNLSIFWDEFDLFYFSTPSYFLIR